MQEKTASPHDFFTRLEAALRIRGIGKSDLAKQVNVSPPTVSRWSSKHLPTNSVLAAIAKVLNVRREWLVAGVEPMESAPVLNDDPEPYNIPEASPDMRFAFELEGFTMGELIRIVRLLTVGNDERPAIVQKIFRRMEELESASSK